MQARRLSLLAILSLETNGLAFWDKGDNESLRLVMAGRVKGLEFQTRALDRVWDSLFKVYATQIEDRIMNLIDDTGKRKMMCVSGCGGDALRFVRGQLARGSENLTSGHLASETLLGDTGREGYESRSPGLPHWRTWHTHGVPCWAVRTSFSQTECRSIERGLRVDLDPWTGERFGSESRGRRHLRSK